MSNPNTEIEKGDTPPCPEFHNPGNLTPEQYGAAERWRLLLTDEILEMRVDEILYEDGKWRGVLGLAGKAAHEAECPSRTKRPLPGQQEPAPSPERQGALWSGAKPADFAEARHQSGYSLSGREIAIARWFYDSGKLAGAAK